MFFSPRLEIMGLQPERHFALAQYGDETASYRMQAQQFQRPTCASFRRIAARQGNYLLLLSHGELRRRARTRCVVHGPRQAARAKAFAHLANAPLGTTYMRSNLLVGKPRIGFQQNLRPLHNTYRLRASLTQTLQPLSCLFREANNVFLHAVAYTTGGDFME